MKAGTRSVSILLSLGVMLCCAGSAYGQLSVAGLTLLTSERVDRTNYRYTFQVQVTNDGADAGNVAATLTSSSPHTMVLDGIVTFGDVPAGATATSTDMCTIQHDRAYPYDVSALVWDIHFDTVVGPAGGIFEGEGGVSVIVPPGAVDQPVPLTIQSIPEGDLGAQIPPGFSFLGAAALNIGGLTLKDNADISILSPPGLPADAEIYVAKVVEYAGTKMFMMVDTATVLGGSIVSQDPAFPGIIDGGLFCFLWGPNVGWIGGTVTRAANGEIVPGAVVTLSGGYWLDIADAAGAYGLPAWAGNFVVVGFDDVTGDHGEAAGFMPADGASVVADVAIGGSAGEVQAALTNGDFETGNLTGWEPTGAATVVSALGPILPYEGSHMASISSGAGAIGEASSALEQSFTVPAGATTLTLHYNFVSEEYPEFVGSEYNDVFNATLHTPDGSRQVAFEEVNSALFQPVNGIPCGSGDCTWGQTGWQTATLDVSTWAGTGNTLTLTVHDVGDTIYDTITLLDKVELGLPCNAPVKVGFLKIASPTCEQRWDVSIFLTELYNYRYRIALESVLSRIEGVDRTNEIIGRTIDGIDALLALYDLRTLVDLNVVDRELVGAATALSLETMLISPEWAGFMSASLLEVVNNVVKGGDPVSDIIFIATNAANIANDLIAALSISELTERYVERFLAREFLLDYYKYGSSLQLLLKSYGLGKNATIEDAIHAFGFVYGYSDNWWWFEDYQTENVKDLILKSLILVAEKRSAFVQ